MKQFIEDSNKPISVIKGVKRKDTLRYVYLNFIVEAFRSHPLIQNIDTKNLNCSAFQPYQSILYHFGTEMFNFMFCGEEKYGCIDSGDEVKVTSAEGNYTTSHTYSHDYLSIILFLAFASLLKDRLSDRFSAQVNYIPSIAIKRSIRKNEGSCYIDKGTKMSRSRMSNCNNTIYNYGSSHNASASIPCEDRYPADYNLDDPYNIGSSIKHASTGTS